LRHFGLSEPFLRWRFGVSLALLGASVLVFSTPFSQPNRTNNQDAAN